MRKILSITIVLILFFCKEPTADNSEQLKEKVRIEKSVEKKAIEKKLDEGIRFLDFPNEDTTTEILKSNSAISDTTLISLLKPYLDKQKFSIQSNKLISSNSYSNCQDNSILKIEGNGIKPYYIKRTEAKPKNYYPDFTMVVHEFENEDQAIKAEERILVAFKSSHGFCNGKDPNYIVRDNTKIIHLTTRAEMFRAYTKDIAEKIKDHN